MNISQGCNKIRNSKIWLKGPYVTFHDFEIMLNYKKKYVFIM